MAPPARAEAARLAWERAYRDFETPRQEVRKFARRLRQLDVHRWDKNLHIVELFCGRGNGLVALNEIGFTQIEGLDLSPDLAALCPARANARVTVGDARHLPFESGSREVIIVQGGLHHLELLDDLRQTLDEIRRVLTASGRLVMVEPWLTPFLRLAHFLCETRLARRASKRIDALATMIELEGTTYKTWLASGDEILALVRERFELAIIRRARGKLMLVGERKSYVGIASHAAECRSIA